MWRGGTWGGLGGVGVVDGECWRGGDGLPSPPYHIRQPLCPPLRGGESDVDEPQEDEESRRSLLVPLGPAELEAELGAAQHERAQAEERAHGEDGYLGRVRVRVVRVRVRVMG